MRIVPCSRTELTEVVSCFPDSALKSFLEKAAIALEQKKLEQWQEAVNSIDFSHSSRNAWNTTNKLTGKSGHSYRL